MSSYNLPSVTQSLFRDQLSRLFAEYIIYCGIFLAHFLIKIDPSIISSLHIVFSLGVMSVQILPTHRSRCRCKWDVTIEYLTRATFEKQLTTLHVVRINIFSGGMCLFCRQKCGPRPKLFLRLDIFSTLVGHIILTYLRKPSLQITKSNKHANDGIWICPWPNTNDSTRSLSPDIENIKSKIHREIAPSKPIQKNVIGTLNKSLILQHSLPLKNCSNQNVWCNSSTPSSWRNGNHGRTTVHRTPFPLEQLSNIFTAWVTRLL